MSQTSDAGSIKADAQRNARRVGGSLWASDVWCVAASSSQLGHLGRVDRQLDKSWQRFGLSLRLLARERWLTPDCDGTRARTLLSGSAARDRSVRYLPYLCTRRNRTRLFLGRSCCLLADLVNVYTCFLCIVRPGFLSTPVASFRKWGAQQIRFETSPMTGLGRMQGFDSITTKKPFFEKTFRMLLERAIL